MIEAILLVLISGKLKKAALQKGRSVNKFILFGIIMWFLGEIVGISTGIHFNLGQSTYVLSLVCSSMGLILALLIALAQKPSLGYIGRHSMPSALERYRQRVRMEPNGLHPVLAPRSSRPNWKTYVRSPQNPYKPVAH